MKRAILFTVGCLIAAGFTDGGIQAQPFRRDLALQQQFFNNQLHTLQTFNSAFNSQMGARNPYFTYNNQMQLLQSPMAQGGIYYGNWQSQALLNSTAARTYGTDYGIPFNYGQVANYYSPGYYNPYAASAAYSTPFANPYAYGGFGYGAGFGNPYAPAAPGYGIGANTYAPYGGGGGEVGNGYNPYNPYNPYGGGGYGNPFDTTGAALMGSADVMRSYGKVINDQEQARILREQALQAQLETKKKKFDLDMYIKANTPTYTQEQEVAARNTLRRIQTNSLPGEVQSGKSLNYLLKDLSKFPNKLGEGKTALEPLPLSETILNHVNVTKGNYGIGLLRDNGRITWPTAIQLPPNQRKELEEQIKGLVKAAYKGNVDVNVLKDVRNEMDRIRDDLVKKVNEIPSAQYMDAKRFLAEFDQATIALERGQAPVQAKFQQFVERGRAGRSVQELAEYMVKEGLRFAPATAEDEAAYRAVHSAMVTYDVSINAQFAAADAQ